MVRIFRTGDKNRRQGVYEKFLSSNFDIIFIGGEGSSGFLETGITNIRMSPNFNSNIDNTS